jgi:hypothetical protein
MQLVEGTHGNACQGAERGSDGLAEPAAGTGELQGSSGSEPPRRGVLRVATASGRTDRLDHWRTCEPLQVANWTAVRSQFSRAW